jgi:hypothetical protein
MRIRRIYSGRKVRTRRECSAMAVLLLLAAIGADTLGAHGAAFYLLLAAVVVTAHAALQAYGRLVELPGSAPALGAARLNVTLGLLALVLVLVAAAVHADGAVPPVGISAAVASLALLGLQGAVRLAFRQPS